MKFGTAHQYGGTTRRLKSKIIILILNTIDPNNAIERLSNCLKI